MTRTNRTISSAGGVGAPDWDKTKAVDYEIGSQIAEDGVIVFGPIVSGQNLHVYIAVNDKTNVIASFGIGSGAVRDSIIIPVNAGDKVYVGHGDGNAVSTWAADGATSYNPSYGTYNANVSWKFYPGKSDIVDTNKVIVLSKSEYESLQHKRSDVLYFCY